MAEWSRHETVEPERWWNKYKARQVQLIIEGLQEHQPVLPPVEEVQDE